MNTCIVCGRPNKSRNSKTCSFTCRERKKFLDKVESIQSQLDYPLKEIIESLYNEGLHMWQACEMLGYHPLSSHCHMKLFDHFDIKRRPPGGNWIGGITDPTSEAYRKNIARMINNNPSANPEIRKKMNLRKAKHLLANQSELTKLAVKILKEFNVDFVQEKLADKYILDFAIDNIDLEIDGRGHYGHLEKDMERDSVLSSLGWKIIRINADIRRPHILRRNLKKLIISGQIPSRNQA